MTKQHNHYPNIWAKHTNRRVDAFTYKHKTTCLKSYLHVGIETYGVITGICSTSTGIRTGIYSTSTGRLHLGKGKLSLGCLELCYSYFHCLPFTNSTLYTLVAYDHH